MDRPCDKSHLTTPMNKAQRVVVVYDGGETVSNALLLFKVGY